MGLFITLEGTEGSGKSSVMEKVYSRLIDEGYSLIKTREPGGTKIGEEIRNIILDNSNTMMDIKTEALLYAASRRQHLIEKIIPSLKEGKLVFSDRYLDSSLAYQGYARGIGIDEVLKINLFALENQYPDLTLLFDLDPSIGLSRINKDPNHEKNRLDLEKLNFHQKVREGYLILVKQFPDRIKIVDATKPFDEVVETVYSIIKSRLK